MITGIRFRTEGELMVLQVCEGVQTLYANSANWRDAYVTDMLEVSAYTNGTLSKRLDKLERSLEEVVDKVWGDE